MFGKPDISDNVQAHPIWYDHKSGTVGNRMSGILSFWRK